MHDYFCLVISSFYHGWCLSRIKLFVFFYFNYFEIPKRIESLKKDDVISAAKLCLRANNPWALGFYGATKGIKPVKLQNKLSEAYLD